MHLVKALQCVSRWSHIVDKARLLEDQFDYDELRELEQMVDRGDACLEVLVGIHPFTHKLVTKDGAWWLVLAAE